MPRLVFTVNNVDFLLSHRLVLVRGALAAGFEVMVVGPDGPSVARLRELQVPFSRWRLERSGQNIFGEAATLARLARLYLELRPDIVHHVTVKPVHLRQCSPRARPVLRGWSTRCRAWATCSSRRDHAPSLRRRAIAAAYRLVTSTPGSATILQNDDDEADLRALGALGYLAGGENPRLGREPQALPREPEPLRRPHRGPAGPPAPRQGRGGVRRGRSHPQEEGYQRAHGAGGRPRRREPGCASPPRNCDSWVREGIVEWWGHRTDMPEVLRQASIVCLPSYREGLPRALLEAGAVGRAVVTTDVPGCRDVVAGGKLGLLVPARTSQPIADAILELLTKPEKRQALARSLADHAARTFGEEHVLEAHLAVYRRLMAERQLGPLALLRRVVY